jgi:hypothetical protein
VRLRHISIAKAIHRLIAWEMGRSEDDCSIGRDYRFIFSKERDILGFDGLVFDPTLISFIIKSFYSDDRQRNR